MSIREIYVIHHSHTDIGYTDLQERILFTQVNHIRRAVEITAKENPDFRWNCETWFCVTEFLKQASEAEKNAFFALAAEGKIGISANYLNFNDLCDIKALRARLSDMRSLLDDKGISCKSAMIADINGVSMGYRDALIDYGVDFFYTNIHCHHGMYPLRQNQTAYFWECEDGRHLLVWNGEHYNIGNAMGILPRASSDGFMYSYFGTGQNTDDRGELLRDNIRRYTKELEDSGYPYDFLPVSVSGEFSDNAPPNVQVIETIEAYNSTRAADMPKLIMCTLDELYRRIKPKLTDIPAYRGDLTDWWANGIGSAPYYAKHYREAQRIRNICDVLDEKAQLHNADLIRKCENNLLLYAEHTYGHSATASDPCLTIVMNLDIRKNSYASAAHEAASARLNELQFALGDKLAYYKGEGKIRAVSASPCRELRAVEFYIEAWGISAVEVKTEDGRILPSQITSHPRGTLVTFFDEFAPHEDKIYSYRPVYPQNTGRNNRAAYMGAEGILDIVNPLDPVTCNLPHILESDTLSIKWKIDEGILSVYDKKHDRELLKPAHRRLFTPLYELTEIRTNVMEERRRLGRNICGAHVKLSEGILTDVDVTEHSPLFDGVRLHYELPGTRSCSVMLRLYHAIPRVDFTLRIAKTMTDEIESVFIPLTADLPAECVIEKGSVTFRPGIDQIPGTGMEYYVTDGGIAYIGKDSSLLFISRDVPLLYMGEMTNHPIRLCENNPADNARDLYSWVMNNTWETNFKLDLSGCAEFSYTMQITDETDRDACFDIIHGIDCGGIAFIVE